MAKKKTVNEVTLNTTINENAILLSPDAILVKKEWNARSGEWEKDKEYIELKLSIKNDGAVQSPVEVRPTTSEEKAETGKDYFLVTGFRRHHAATELGFQNIPVIVKELSAAAARLRNIQENSLREDLPTPDIAWAIKDLGESATQAEIAFKCGMSQPYVGKLQKLTTNLLGSVFDAWRKASVNVSVTDMLALADCPKDEQMSKFAGMVSQIGKAGGKGKGGWVDTAKKKSYNVGYVVGRLVQRGIIGNVDTSISTYENSDVEILGVKLAKGATDDDKLTILSSFIAGVEQGQEPNKYTENQV